MLEAFAGPRIAFNRDRGATAAEYTPMVGLITIFIIVAITTLANNLHTTVRGAGQQRDTRCDPANGRFGT